MINAPRLACLAVCGAFLYVLGLLPEEGVKCDRGCHGEVISDADPTVGGFRVGAVLVEDGADFRLLHGEVDDGGEVFDGFLFVGFFLGCVRLFV